MSDQQKGKRFDQIVEHTQIFHTILEAFQEKGETGTKPLLAAIIYGRIWYRCRGHEGLFYESKSALAKLYGIDRRSIIRSFDMLLEAGFIFEGGTHHATQAKIYSVDPEKITQAEPITPEGVTLSHRGCDSKSQAHTGGCDSKSHKKNKENNNTKEKVVVDQRIKPKDIALALWNYSLDKCKSDNPEAYARGVLKNNPGWKPPKKYQPDSDSEEMRQRYVTGEYADFWDPSND